MQRGLGGTQSLDVLGFESFITGDDFEANFFPFIQCLEALSGNLRMMHKDILAGILGNEAKPFFVIEPFYLTTGHNFSLLRFGRNSTIGHKNTPSRRGGVKSHHGKHITPRTALTIKTYDDLVKHLLQKTNSRGQRSFPRQNNI